MAKNCLKTTQKGSVVGNDTLKLGYFVINVKESTTASTNVIRLKKTPDVDSVKIYALDGGSFKVGSDTTFVTEHTLNVNTTLNIIPDNKTFRILIGAKYGKMNTINTDNPNIFMDLSELKYINFLENLSLPTNNLSYGDITHVLSLPLTQTSFYNNENIIGSIEGLKDNNVITSILAANTGIVGDISNVNCRSIGTIRFSNTNVSGSLEDFCEAQIANERQSGTSISITVPSTVNLHNVAIDSSKTYTISFSDSGCSISNGSSTVATYDGTNWTYA